MSIKIALLRGVNVGGKNKLPMKALAAALEKTGCENVRTYIQSGNIVFRGRADAEEISKAIKKSFGLDIPAHIMTKATFQKIIDNCPYQKAANKAPKLVHLCFLAGNPAAGASDQFNEIKTAAEEFAFGKGVLYLHTPNGFLESKIAARADRILKIQNTSRNWSTVMKIRDLADTM